MSAICGSVRFELGHALVGAALAHDGRYQDALFIVKNDHGADQVRCARAALCTRAVATCAIGGEELASSFISGRDLL